MPTPQSSLDRRKARSVNVEPRRLLDGNGRPVLGFIKRKTVVADPWVGRKVRLFRPVEHRYDKQYDYYKLAKRAQIQFHGSNQWYPAKQVFVVPKEGCPDIPLMKALRLLSHDFWWVSARGALERRATIYEERMPHVAPPREGWRLLPSAEVASLIGQSKSAGGHSLVPRISETDELDTVRARIRHRQRALQKAELTLLRHTRSRTRTEKLIVKWTERVERLRSLTVKDGT